MDDLIWDVTVFTKNRQRLLAGGITDDFFRVVLKQARQRNLLAGYQVSHNRRKRIEEVFGWMKSIGLLRKLRHRGLSVSWMFTFAAEAYNLMRSRSLIRSAPQPQCAQTVLRPCSQQHSTRPTR
jgi:hypothetical protein